eukprot:9363218-Lingulodinium_polyedra.AAC.1
MGGSASRAVPQYIVLTCLTRVTQRPPREFSKLVEATVTQRQLFMNAIHATDTTEVSETMMVQEAFYPWYQQQYARCGCLWKNLEIREDGM